MKPLDIGCTKERHASIGIDAVINARGGLQKLNDDLTIEEVEMHRDGRKIKDWQTNRVRFYQVNSKFFRRHIQKIRHLLSTYDD